MEFPFSLRPHAEFDAVGFGTNAVDYLIRVPVYPEFNSKIELSDYTIAAGGEIASSMTGLARLGLRCAYAGRFGDDEAGVIGLRSLNDEGVDTAYAETVTRARTQVAFIIVDEKTGERTVIWKRDELLRYTPAEAPTDLAARGRVLHITPHDGEATIRMAAAAKEAGTVVSADVDNLFDGLDELLRLVDICIMSAELPSRFVQIDDPRKALHEISRKYGCGITGLTLGRRGSLMYSQNEFVESTGFDVPGGCVDTTGAGDAFRAGFLYGMLSGYSLEKSSACGNAVASLKCRGMGARQTLPSRTELEDLINGD
jgi:sulfofructose kinase